MKFYNSLNELENKITGIIKNTDNEIIKSITAYKHITNTHSSVLN